MIFKKFQNQEKKNVQNFYDSIGWKMNNNVYEDTAMFEDLRDVSRDYIHKCHLRINRYIKSNGEYILDAASGPIPFPEYLDYSMGYNQRICVDISLLGLKEARKKLGEKGTYILGDITNLPFLNETFDGVISLHTIYHVPKNEQKKAFLELFRVAKSGSSVVVTYSWGRYSVFMFFPTLLYIVRGKIKKLFSLKRSKCSEPNIYYHTHHFIWMISQFSGIFNFEILVCRTVNIYFLKTFIHNKLYGRKILDIIFSIENKIPHLAGLFGQYPLIVIRK